MIPTYRFSSMSYFWVHMKIKIHCTGMNKSFHRSTEDFARWHKSQFYSKYESTKFYQVLNMLKEKEKLTKKFLHYAAWMTKMRAGFQITSGQVLITGCLDSLSLFASSCKAICSSNNGISSPDPAKLFPAL